MSSFAETYLGRLRAIIGNRLVLMPSARLLIEDAEGRILLQHRRDFNVWGLLGGNAEEGEDLQGLVVREALEESGLLVSDVKPYGFANDPLQETIEFPNGDLTQYFAMLFYTHSYLGTPYPADDESHEVNWFSRGALPQMAPNHARSVEAFWRFKATLEFQFI
jgi:8-oxo-dGTP pyrophosphatase MutT (NUDIX family)